MSQTVKHTVLYRSMVSIFVFFSNRNLSNLSFFETQNFPKTSLNFLTVCLFLTIKIVKIITRIPIQISKASFGQSTKK